MDGFLVLGLGLSSGRLGDHLEVLIEFGDSTDLFRLLKTRFLPFSLFRI